MPLRVPFNIHVNLLQFRVLVFIAGVFQSLHGATDASPLPWQCPYISTGSCSHTSRACWSSKQQEVHPPGSLLSTSAQQPNPGWPWACCLCLSTTICNHVGWDMPPLEPRIQKFLVLVCVLYIVCNACAGSSLNAASVKPTPKPKPKPYCPTCTCSPNAADAGDGIPKPADPIHLPRHLLCHFPTPLEQQSVRAPVCWTDVQCWYGYKEKKGLGRGKLVVLFLHHFYGECLQ